MSVCFRALARQCLTDILASEKTSSSFVKLSETQSRVCPEVYPSLSNILSCLSPQLQTINTFAF